MTEAEQRAAVVAEARAWIGTPFHDCAQIKGVGVDCAMLLKAVYERVGLVEDFAVEPYSPQWMLHRTEERFMNTVLRYAREIEEAQVKPGDVALYKVAHCYAHGAIVVDWPNQIVHAHKQCKGVVQASAFDGDLRGRKVKFFSFW